MQNPQRVHAHSRPREATGSPTEALIARKATSSPTEALIARKATGSPTEVPIAREATRRPGELLTPCGVGRNIERALIRTPGYST
ncbi:hypothetical protein [Dactylosporangium sp. CS-033363]|uniref:hypothetical protein n=1 Tax=Dactylosporangium sp. CS-033363 TaxID=3239935 RepID=UPI003D92AC9D